MTTRVMTVAAALGLLFCEAAFGWDSGGVRSGVARYQVDGVSSRIGISTVVDDYRAGGGFEREWVLSWVYAASCSRVRCAQPRIPRTPSIGGRAIRDNAWPGHDQERQEPSICRYFLLRAGKWQSADPHLRSVPGWRREFQPS